MANERERVGRGARDVRRRRDHEQQQEPGTGRVDGEPVRLLPAQQAFPSRHPTRVGAGTPVGVPPQDDRAAATGPPGGADEFT